MEVKDFNQPLVVIVGPTASGKTSLAINIAKRFNGEIVCADSRSIYKYMNIGTAKPTKEEQLEVKHWGLDLVEPGEYFSVADFKDYALRKINEIRERSRLPILVGGTGLYIDSVIFDYKFGPPADESKRHELQQKTIDELHEYCRAKSIPLPENSKNKRYVIRTIERFGYILQKNNEPLQSTIIVGITTDKDVLLARISGRFDQMLENGLIEETKWLADKFDWDSEAMKSNIYPLIRQYFDGELTINDVKNNFITLDWRLTKRQLTWLRRDSYIKWFSLKGAESYLCNVLASIE